jgi:hypothetical protein
MSRAGDFRRVLDRLFEKRTHDIRYVLDGRPLGAAPKFNRTIVDDAINELQTLVSDHFAQDLARQKFESSVRSRKSWHPKRGKGWGREKKKTAFKEWYDEHFGTAPCIYVFWSGSVCEYVGKTGSGGHRPAAHFEKFWFSWVTRIDIYRPHGTRALPALECLGIHRFQPRQNKSRAETRKWQNKCPLCDHHKTIEEELRSLFRLRR